MFIHLFDAPTITYSEGDSQLNLSSTECDAGADDLMSTFSSFLKSVEKDSQIIEGFSSLDNNLNPHGYLLTRFFTDVVVCLLERAGPSQELVECLKDKDKVIHLLCRSADTLGYGEGERARVVWRYYLSVSLILQILGRKAYKPTLNAIDSFVPFWSYFTNYKGAEIWTTTSSLSIGVGRIPTLQGSKPERFFEITKLKT